MKSYVKDEIENININIKTLQELISNSCNDRLIYLIDLLKFSRKILLGNHSFILKDNVLFNLSAVYVNIGNEIKNHRR